jgi:proline iminopeptidase
MLSREYDNAAVQLIKNKTSVEDSTRRAQLMAGGNLSMEQYDELMHISFNASAYDRSSIKQINLNLPPDFMDANRILFTGLMKDQAAQANLYDSVKKITCPVLIIHGEADAIPLPSIERLKNNIQNSTIVILNKSGHFPFIEERETYLRIVTDFILSKK